MTGDSTGWQKERYKRSCNPMFFFSYGNGNILRRSKRVKKKQRESFSFIDLNESLIYPLPSMLE
jgi:hypothetical protein